MIFVNLNELFFQMLILNEVYTTKLWQMSFESIRLHVLTFTCKSNPICLRSRRGVAQYYNNNEKNLSANVCLSETHMTLNITRMPILGLIQLHKYFIHIIINFYVSQYSFRNSSLNVIEFNFTFTMTYLLFFQSDGNLIPIDLN